MVVPASVNKFLGSLIIGVVLLTAYAQAQQASARFSPSRIYPDELTTYEVTVEGANRTRAVDLPSVEGLSIVSTQQSSSMRIINGQMNASITLTYGIKASKAGTYTMPSFRIGETTVPAATLEVLPMTASRQQELEERDRRQREAQKEILGMELNLPETTVYVGQAVPMRLTIYVRGDLYAEPMNRPVKEGDAFTLAEFPERPSDQTDTRNGRRYRNFHWENILTPLKAGAFDLSFSENFVIGRSFFNQQQVALSSEPLEVNVLPLPTPGRPEDFDGAIGNFTIERPTLDATKVQAGEPVTLRVNISGEGNFDRMGPPVLTDTDGWRVYPPTDSFDQKGPFGYRGVKTYEYVLIPKSEAVTQSPRMRFSFFEPEAAEYVALEMEPQKIDVLPAPPGSRPIYEPKRPETNPRGPSLLPNMPSLGPTTEAIRPVFFEPWFLAAQSLPLIAILGLFFLRRQALRLESDGDYARRRRARRETTRCLQGAEKAAAAQDAPQFYDRARRAIQEAVAPHLRREPESLTWHEIEAFLAGRGLDHDSLMAARVSFEAGDALRFGGMAAQSVDFPGELARVKALVATLEGGRR